MIFSRILILFLFLIPFLSFADSNLQWNLKAGAFNRVMNDQSYIVTSFKPYLSYAKFYLAMDLEFQFEKSGALKQDDWDNWKAIKQKFEVVGYGTQEDPFFFRLGILDDVSLGYGILVNHFRNDTYYPNTKKLGLFAGYDLGYNGAALFTENTVNFKMLGGRLFMRPLYGLDSKNTPEAIRKFQIGFSYVLDSDPYDQDSGDINASFFGNDNKTSGSVATKAYAFDIMVPYYTDELFSLNNYIQYGSILNLGSAIGYGFLGKVFKYLDYKAEIIYSWNGFIPSYFNSFYDQREVRMNQYTNAASAANGWGYLASIGSKLFDNQFIIGIEFSGSKQNSPMFMAYSQLKPTLLQRLYLKLSYQKKNISGITDLFMSDSANLSTIFISEIGYEISNNATISFRYIKNFVEMNGQVQTNSVTEIQTNLLF